MTEWSPEKLLPSQCVCSKTQSIQDYSLLNEFIYQSSSEHLPYGWSSLLATACISRLIQ